MKKLEALTIIKYGDTFKCKIGEYDRQSKTLEVKKFVYYTSQRPTPIKTIGIKETIKFNNPEVYRTKFWHPELNKYYVIEEKKTW